MNAIEKLEEQKYEQIRGAIRQFRDQAAQLQMEAEWFIGMLLYDHGTKHPPENQKACKQFQKHLANRLSKDLIEPCPAEWLQDSLDTYLAYPLLEEIIVERWVKKYDIREYEHLRPELVSARETIVEKATANGIDGASREKARE